jgi:kynureninase
VAELLKEKKILVSPRQDVIRIAPHFYNTHNDVKAAVDELIKVVNSEPL